MSTTPFDQKAATWDENPSRLALAQALAAGIRQAVPLRPHWRALEYGCGTATLSFLLAGDLGPIMAADTSAGMLAQVRKKADAAGVGTVTPLELDLTRMPPPATRFDLVMCAMALHHVKDADGLLRAFAALLAPGGWLAVADLETEDGSFHTEEPVPHHGFAPDALAQILTAAGLRSAAWRTPHVLQRHGRSYPVFLLTATTS